MAYMEIAESSTLRRFKCKVHFTEVSLVKGEKVEVPSGWAISALSHSDLLFSFTKEDEAFFKGLSEDKIAAINRQVEEEILSPKDAIALFIPKTKAKKTSAPKTPTKTSKAKKE